MGRTPMSGGTAFRFLPAEVADMEKALEASNGATPARAIVEGLADKFTSSSERNGQRPVQWKQVWNWFQNRRHAQKAKTDKLKAVGSGGETPPAAPKPATVAGTSTAKKTSEPVTMDFEAKSARDGAWYDVSAFIDKRNSESGEPEVKVRFAGFGSEEDEWVNIANAVRQRSLPCETSECVAVLPGDLILCFQEGSEQALYFDADILDVQRRRHDVRGCRCRFWVRYRHDQTEEVVPLRKVCRRPETEQRLQQAREASAASSKLSTKDIAIERALNAIPNLNTTPQIPPTTPVTPAQPGSAFNATPNLHTGTSPNLYTPVQPDTSIPGIQPMQPIPMQSMSTPDTTSSIHQQATPPPVAPTHSINVLQVAAVSSQGPTPSMPIATQSTTQPMSTSASAQQSLPSIESSIARQLTISVPAQQAPRDSAGVGLSVSGAAHQELTPGAPVVKPIVSGVPEQRTVATTGVAEPSNSAQPMEVVSDVSLAPAVDPAGPSNDAPVNASAANAPI